MRETESLHIYALRLEQLAEKIYHGRFERERQLSKKFARTVPRSFASVLSTHERDLFAAGKDSNWQYYKSLAAAQDRHDRISNGENLNFRDETFDGKDQTVRRSNRRPREIFLGNATTPVNAEVGNRKPKESTLISRCDWCGRKGHFVKNCWIRLGFCEMCGSEDHLKEECRKFESKRNLFKPRCPVCKGSHLGRDCEQLNW